MYVCYNCKTELPAASGITSSLLIGNAICPKCDTWNDIPVAIMENEARKTYSTCALWDEKNKDIVEKFQWSNNGTGVCFECGEPFPTKDLQKRADEHEKEHQGFRRAHSQCPLHNYGDVALFERDCEYVS